MSTQQHRHGIVGYRTLTIDSQHRPVPARHGDIAIGDHGRARLDNGDRRIEDLGKPGHRVGGGAGAVPWTVNPSSVGVVTLLRLNRDLITTIDLSRSPVVRKAQCVDMNAHWWDTCDGVNSEIVHPSMILTARAVPSRRKAGHSASYAGRCVGLSEQRSEDAHDAEEDDDPDDDDGDQKENQKPEATAVTLSYYYHLWWWRGCLAHS